MRAGVSLIDIGTGVWAALGVIAALYEREQTGVGRTLDVSLYETALSLLSYQLVGFLGTGVVPGREGSAFSQIAPYQVFPTRDGELMIVAGNDKLYAALCGELGVPELIADERFLTNPLRVANRPALLALLEEKTRERDTVELLDALVAAGVPASPGARRRRGGTPPADGGARHPPVAAGRRRRRSRHRRRPALGRRRARPPPLPAARARRAQRGDPAGARLLGEDEIDGLVAAGVVYAGGQAEAR